NLTLTPDYKKHYYLRPVLELGKLLIMLSRNNQNFLIIAPIKHYDTPIGAVIVEIDLKDMLSRILPSDESEFYETEIQERKDAAERLEFSETRLRSILENMLDGIITINEQGIVNTFNPAAERIFGYNKTEIIGKNIKILMPDPYHREHDTYINKYLKTKTPKIIGSGREVTARRKDGGHFPIDLSVSATLVKGKQMFVGIIRDITDRKI
ncbi:MAG: hypothetical protein OMM_15155, partial [Candidatus Magnetoglobus multicellularis str. Araruama]